MFTLPVCVEDQETALADSQSLEGQIWSLTCNYIFVGFGKQREKRERKQTVTKNRAPSTGDNWQEWDERRWWGEIMGVRTIKGDPFCCFVLFFPWKWENNTYKIYSNHFYRGDKQLDTHTKRFNLNWLAFSPFHSSTTATRKVYLHKTLSNRQQNNKLSPPFSGTQTQTAQSICCLPSWCRLMVSGVDKAYERLIHKRWAGPGRNCEQFMRNNTETTQLPGLFINQGQEETCCVCETRLDNPVQKFRNTM